MSSYEAAAGLVSGVSADIFLCKAEHILGNLLRLSAGAGGRGDSVQCCHDCECVLQFRHQSTYIDVRFIDLRYPHHLYLSEGFNDKPHK